MEATNISYDTAHKQIVFSLGELRLTIPDTLTLSNIEAYLTDMRYKVGLELMRKNQIEAMQNDYQTN